MQTKIPGHRITRPIRADSNRRANHKTIIDGCAVSLSSATKGTVEPLTTVKEILIAAYRTKNTSA